jgi:serine/threonine protein kinase, bacterial
MRQKVWSSLFIKIPRFGDFSLFIFNLNLRSMKRLIFFIIPTTTAFGMIIASCTKNHQYDYFSNAVVTTLASEGPGVYSGGNYTSSSFNNPTGVAVDGAGNVYVADELNNLIEKISPSGEVSNLAGSGSYGSANGTGTAASFNGPYGVAVDRSGNAYVADAGNNLIRKISPSGVVTTLAGNLNAPPDNIIDNGTGAAASFNYPSGVAVDGSGYVYVADQGDNVIRKISPIGVVTTFAGNPNGNSGDVNGTGTAALLSGPFGLAIDDEEFIYATEGEMIIKVNSSAVVTTLAGNGLDGSTNAGGTAATFNFAQGVAVDNQGNVYVADSGNNLIRKINPQGEVTTLAGTGEKGSANGPGAAATFNNPSGIAVDAQGNVYVADTGNNLIRKITQ